ncbi:MAG: DMT family transporter [Nitriliruptoraceae bacterium]
MSAEPMPPTPPLPRATILAAIVVGVIAVSTSAILARFAMGDEAGLVRSGDGAASALAIAFWRTSVGSLALAPAAWRHRRRSGRGLSRRRHLHLAAAGLALAAHFVLFQGALTLTTVASAVTLTTMSPLFVALGGWWLLGERTTRRAWLGMVVTIAGAAVIGIADAGAEALGSGALIGDGMALGAAIGATAYLLLGRSARRDTATSTYAATVYGWAGIVLLPVCLVAGVPLTGFSAGTWAAIAGIIIGPQLLGHTVFNHLLSTLAATTVSIVILAEPVGAGLLAWFLLGELPAPLFAIGAPLVLLGVLVVIRASGAAAPDPTIRTPSAGSSGRRRRPRSPRAPDPEPPAAPRSPRARAGPGPGRGDSR